MLGEHLIINAKFKNDKMGDVKYIDNFLFEITKVSNMTLAVPPISLKFPVDDNLYKTVKSMNELNTLCDRQKKEMISTLRAKDDGWLGGEGVSGTAIWVESHLAIHTWTKYNEVTLDLFTCKTIDHKFLIDKIKNLLNLKEGSYVYIKRAIKDNQIEKGVL